MGEQGRVLLRVVVTAAGLAEQVELKASSGTERLDRAAIDAVKRWRFVPARQGDQPVAAWVVDRSHFLSMLAKPALHSFSISAIVKRSW